MIYNKGTKLKHKIEKVDLDADNFVFVSELGSLDFQELKAKYPDNAPSPESEVKLAYEFLSYCVKDETGKKLFSDAADVENNFDVGMSTVWAIRDKILDMSRSKANDEKK